VPTIGGHSVGGSVAGIQRYSFQEMMQRVLIPLSRI
jgi:hypothetical protein